MHFTKTLALLAIPDTGLSYVVEVYDSADCQGFLEKINVYDNTCATGHPNVKSFKPTAYGKYHQKATFYEAEVCNILDEKYVKFWADGGGNNFQVGKCTNLDFTAKTLGSNRGA